jgi:single-strand DNA-binding protein
MAGSVNKVILIGRLGKDPEMKYTPSGAPVCKFSLATDAVWKDKTGEQQQQTEWHNIVTWGKLAEICAEYLAKGRQVYIEGSIRSRQWEDKQTGNKRTAYEIVARQMTMLGSRADSERASAERSSTEPAPSERPAPPPADVPPEPEITDEDIPF